MSTQRPVVSAPADSIYRRYWKNTPLSPKNN